MCHEGMVLCLDFGGTNEKLMLASGSDDGTVKVWQVEHGKLLRQIAIEKAVSIVRF